MLWALLGAAWLCSAFGRSPLLQVESSELFLPRKSEALDAAAAEDEAQGLLEPHLKDMKALEKEARPVLQRPSSGQVVELVVMRQWWSLARELVAKSHEQKAPRLVFTPFSARWTSPSRCARQFEASRRLSRPCLSPFSLQDEADELLRTLNPNYGMAQQVSPAFQWAQNDTSLFLTIKPGASIIYMLHNVTHHIRVYI